MARAPSKNLGVIVKRRKDTIALPPGILGFADIDTPNTFDPAKPMWKLNIHYNPAGLAALKVCIQRDAIDANLDKLREEMAENSTLKGLVGAEPQSPETWLAAKLKEPSEKSKVQLPGLALGTKAERKGRDGEPYKVALGVWDQHNGPLDLKALKLGMGSCIQPIVHANLFISKLIGFPQPTLDLVGFRVIKLVRWGGVRPPTETDDAAIKDILGEDFDGGDDLSAFAAGLPGTAPGTPEADGDTVAGAF